MTSALIFVIGTGVILCLIATMTWRTRWRTRIAIFIGGLIAFIACFWLMTALPSRYISLYMFILPIGPAIIFITGLFTRRTTSKVIGLVLSILLILSYSYVAMATHASYADDAIDGVLHLPTFLKGQGFVKDNLNDPNSASFKELRLRKYKDHQYMCGEVNARNRMGGLVGYTRFYVQTDQYTSFPFFDNDPEHNSFNQFMTTCYGDDWNKDLQK